MQPKPKHLYSRLEIFSVAKQTNKNPSVFFLFHPCIQSVWPLLGKKEKVVIPENILLD